MSILYIFKVTCYLFRPGQRPPFRPPFSHINRFPGNQRFPGHQRFPGPRFPGQRFHRPPSNQQEPRIVHQQPPPRVVMADGSLQRPAVIQQPLHQVDFYHKHAQRYLMLMLKMKLRIVQQFLSYRYRFISIILCEKLRELTHKCF